MISGPPPAAGHFPLAQALRESTRALHVEVEHTAFMQGLLRGRVGRPRYALFLRNLLALYAALETALSRHQAHAGLAPLRLDGLARAPLLAEDLLHLAGTHWQDELGVLPAARAYVERLADLERDDPPLLAAHAYVRYLGDLNGGQALQRIVARSLGLEGADGTRFYAFGPPEAAAALARRFRLGLDQIAADAPGAARLVAEAQQGFVRHRRLFEELEAALLPLPQRGRERG